MGKRIPMKEMVPIMTESMESGGKVKFTPTGISMLPLFRDRQDEVYMVKPDSKLKKYDIALYERSPDKYVLHRVIKVKKGVQTFRGDNQYIDEPGIDHSQIIGVVIGFCKDGKYRKTTDFSYRIYSFIRVNTVLIRRVYSGIKRRIKRYKQEQ